MLVYVPEYYKLIKDNDEFLKNNVDKGSNIIVIHYDGPYSEDGEPQILEVNIEMLKNKIIETRYPFGHVVADSLLDINYIEYTN